MSVFAFDPWAVLKSTPAPAAPPKAPNSPNQPDPPAPRLGGLGGLGGCGSPQPGHLPPPMSAIDEQTACASIGKVSTHSDAWRDLPFGRERGRAFNDARRELGACRCCAGRRWWTEATVPTGWRCVECHPPDHLAPERVRWRTPNNSSDARAGRVVGGANF